MLLFYLTKFSLGKISDVRRLKLGFSENEEFNSINNLDINFIHQLRLNMINTQNVFTEKIKEF